MTIPQLDLRLRFMTTLQLDRGGVIVDIGHKAAKGSFSASSYLLAALYSRLPTHPKQASERYAT
jgi:hypothetical protein